MCQKNVDITFGLIIGFCIAIFIFSTCILSDSIKNQNTKKNNIEKCTCLDLKSDKGN